MSRNRKGVIRWRCRTNGDNNSMGRKQEAEESKRRLEILWDSVIVVEKTIVRQLEGIKQVIQRLMEDVDALEEDDSHES